MQMTFEEWLQELQKMQNQGLDAQSNILQSGAVMPSPTQSQAPDVKSQAFSLAEGASSKLGPIGLPVAMALGATNEGTKTPTVGQAPDFAGGMKKGAEAYTLSTLLQAGGDLLKGSDATNPSQASLTADQAPRATQNVSVFEKPTPTMGDTYKMTLMERGADGKILTAPTTWDKTIASAKQAGSDILRGTTKGISDIVMGKAQSNTPYTGAVGLDFTEGFKRGGDLGNIYGSLKEGNIGGGSGQTLRMVMREYPSFDATIKAQEEERRKKLRGY